MSAAIGLGLIVIGALLWIFPQPLYWMDDQLSGRWAAFLEKSGYHLASRPYSTGLTKRAVRIAFPATSVYFGARILLGSI